MKLLSKILNIPEIEYLKALELLTEFNIPEDLFRDELFNDYNFINYVITHNDDLYKVDVIAIIYNCILKLVCKKFISDELISNIKKYVYLKPANLKTRFEVFEHNKIILSLFDSRKDYEYLLDDSFLKKVFFKLFNINRSNLWQTS